ncbi:MAG: toprim domain-containing protein, partial [Acidobacteriota bacterium]|nr:toprim domain-containing protein [Acidobacteriota bacterium]
GLGEETLREFRVGYAPSAWDRVLLASRRGGYSEAELVRAGLAQRSRERGKVYDRFRARIVFPLIDLRSRVLGFGARAMGDGQGPKYLNSAESELYHKGNHLYGADRARRHATDAGEVIVCEGYTDVIALHQAGLPNAVGLMGTALTPAQVGELARLAPRILLALDADSAGQEAMLRAARLAASRRLELDVVRLVGPDDPADGGAAANLDPADFVQRFGGDAMRAAVAAAVPFIRFRVERVLGSGDHASAAGRDRMVEELRPVLATIPPSALRMDMTRLISSRLELPEGVAERLLTGTAPQAEAHASGRQGPQGRQLRAGMQPPPDLPQALRRREQVERAFLALCLAHPEHGAAALAAIDPVQHLTAESLRRAAAHLGEHGLSDPLAGVSSEDGELLRVLGELAAQAGMLDEGQGRAPERAAERARAGAAQIDAQRLQLELSGLERQIRAARGAERDEQVDVSALAARRIEVKREFDRAQERALDVAGLQRS